MMLHAPHIYLYRRSQSFCATSTQSLTVVCVFCFNQLGGYPTATAEQSDKLAALSLQDKYRLQNLNAKVKVGPWSKTRTFTKYTAHGTALLDYQKLALERNIQNALALHEAEVREEAAAVRAASSRKSSRRSKRAGKG